jgi:hypothetical protein
MRARRRRIGVPAGSAGVIVSYLTVSVPVMFAIGWMEQMKVYVPASRGGMT